MATITVRGLTKRFGALTAVDDLSFDVERGSITGFVGPNGAGKTTTLRMLLGLVHPTAGTALVDGTPYARLDHPALTVGAALEATGFHPGRTARNHLRTLAMPNRIPVRRVDEVLAEVDLTDAARRRVGGFSLGMRQRLQLAGALLGDPPVLVLDEPTTGLDRSASTGCAGSCGSAWTPAARCWSRATCWPSWHCPRTPSSSCNTAGWSPRAQSRSSREAPPPGSGSGRHRPSGCVRSSQPGASTRTSLRPTRWSRAASAPGRSVRPWPRPASSSTRWPSSAGTSRTRSSSLTAALALQPVLGAGRDGVPSIGTVGATLGVLDAMAGAPWWPCSSASRSPRPTRGTARSRSACCRRPAGGAWRPARR